MSMGLFYLMYMAGLLAFVKSMKHFLLMLLSMEFVVLSLFYGFYLLYYSFDYEGFFSMMFLIMSVCEGALGLSILVAMVRGLGNDFLKSFNLLW